MTKEDDLKEVAQRLCANAGFSAHQKYTMPDGVEIPLWVTFISRAQQLIQERKAFS